MPIYGRAEAASAAGDPLAEGGAAMRLAEMDAAVVSARAVAAFAAAERALQAILLQVFVPDYACQITAAPVGPGLTLGSWLNHSI